MGVYVRYMKMPESCLKCPMQFGGWCYASPPEIDERVAPTVDEAAEQGKPEWCPLVEVPDPHGRLIDVNDVKSRMIPLSFSVQKWIGEVELSNCKTVIEAEGE